MWKLQWLSIAGIILPQERQLLPFARHDDDELWNCEIVKRKMENGKWRVESGARTARWAKFCADEKRQLLCANYD